MTRRRIPPNLASETPILVVFHVGSTFLAHTGQAVLYRLTESRRQRLVTIEYRQELAQSKK